MEPNLFGKTASQIGSGVLCSQLLILSSTYLSVKLFVYQKDRNNTITIFNIFHNYQIKSFFLLISINSRPHAVQKK